MTIKLPYKLLIYDIETAPLEAYIWRLGEQSVRHGQLVKGRDNYSILTISYKWFGDKKTHCLDYTDPKMLEKFDEQIKKADVTLGKNSDRFDVKHINTQRMLNNLPPLTQWSDTSEDLEKQLRKYFVFPSQSLDYISSMFGEGGKEKMEFQDWIDIVNLQKYEKLLSDTVLIVSKKGNNGFCKSLFGMSEAQVVKKGKSALKKMRLYNMKDVDDTSAILERVLPYIKLKHNASIYNDGAGCITCGSGKIVPTKVVIIGKTKYQQFECLSHNGYAGKATWKYSKNRNKIFGKMG